MVHCVLVKLFNILDRDIKISSIDLFDSMEAAIIVSLSAVAMGHYIPMVVAMLIAMNRAISNHSIRRIVEALLDLLDTNTTTTKGSHEVVVEAVLVRQNLTASEEGGEREERGRRGRQFIRENYSIDGVAERYIALYHCPDCNNQFRKCLNPSIHFL